ncbi:MAG: 4Fe-4S binding protein [Kiritimatiellota bacterium]|nr:4Fe-4S binding protein [Kiritimatiellota bacterium]
MNSNAEISADAAAGQLAALEITVPRPAARGIIRAVLDGIGSLLKGMKVTFYYISHPSTVVTQQYPENRKTLRMAPRFRGQLAFVRDENNYHKCIACHICETACPNGSINVVARKGPVTGKNEIDCFVWRFDSCTFCNMCVIACPSAALMMRTGFESAVYDQRLLIYNLNHYAGPASAALMKVTDPEERGKMMEPRRFYEGPMPLCGTRLPGCPAGPAARETPLVRSTPVAPPVLSIPESSGEKKC